MFSEFSSAAFERFRERCVVVRDAAIAVERRQLFDRIRVWHSSTKWSFYEVRDDKY